MVIRKSFSFVPQLLFSVLPLLRYQKHCQYHLLLNHPDLQVMAQTHHVPRWAMHQPRFLLHYVQIRRAVRFFRHAPSLTCLLPLYAPPFEPFLVPAAALTSRLWRLSWLQSVGKMVGKTV
jgi:hypothetical protein